MPEYEPVTINLTAKIKADLKALAEKRAASISQTIRDAIMAAVEREKRDAHAR